MSELLAEMVSRLFAAHGEAADQAEGGVWPDALWQAVVEAGLPAALVEEGEASLGVSTDEAFAIVRLAGRHAVAVPIPETMLANRVLASCGLVPVDGPAVVIADVALALAADGTRLTGTARSVPWGRRARILALVESDGAWWLALPGRAGITVTEGESIAREPRDHLTFDAALASMDLVPVPTGLDRSHLRAAGAALRCAQIAGALEGATALTLAYTAQRVQFGKPLAKFQAVQQNLAVLAEQAAAARAAADLAAEALSDGLDVARIAAAKTFASEAAGVGAAIAHQMHGAMGFARAYPLHRLTRRLWSWREEYGNEAEWSAWLGRDLAKRGADQLWAGITAL